MADTGLKPFPEDMSEVEVEELQTFLDSGCPGLSKISESDIFQWFQLYMFGKTYTEISIATRKQKQHVLFMSYKQDWFEKKMRHVEDLLNNIEDKVKKIKLESLNTVSTIVASLGQYYGDKFTKYMVSKDESIIENLDTKLLSQYYKSIETVDKVIGNSVSSSSPESGPLVNLNFNSSDAEVKQIDANTLEITDSQAGNLLKLLAKAKKSEKE